MSLVEAIVLGLVQGLTEFLPISSTGHLRLVPAVLGWDDPGAAYSALIQCGTLVAVLIAMRQDVVALIRGFVAGVAAGRPWGTVESRVAIMIVIGTLPIVVVGLAARDFIRGAARDLEVVVVAVLGGTILMAAAELVCLARARRSHHGGRDGLESIRLSDAVSMGLAQVLALVPGASRSGTTISSGMITGLDRRTAARFSFLLSLPAVGAAGLLEAWKERHEILATGDDIRAALVGTLVAGIAGYVSIRWLLRMLTSHTLWPFIVYRLALAALLAAGFATQAVVARAEPFPAGRVCPPEPGAGVTPARWRGQDGDLSLRRFRADSEREFCSSCSATSTTGAARPGSSPAS